MRNPGNPVSSAVGTFGNSLKRNSLQRFLLTRPGEPKCSHASVRMQVGALLSLTLRYLLVALDTNALGQDMAR
jgi:hypothetical protein